MCIYYGVRWGVGTGIELQRVHVLSLLEWWVCFLCCRGLGWLLRWWGGEYLLLIGLMKAVVSCELGG